MKLTEKLRSICNGRCDCKKRMLEQAQEVERLKAKLKAAEAEKRACFRLGQMDMRQAAVDALMEMASKQSGATRSTLLIGANMLQELEIMGRG